MQPDIDPRTLAALRRLIRENGPARIERRLSKAIDRFAPRKSVYDGLTQRGAIETEARQAAQDAAALIADLLEGLDEM